MAKSGDDRKAPARGDERSWLGRDWGAKSESNPGLRGLLGGSGIGRQAFTEEWLSFQRLRAERDRLAFAESPREELRESRGKEWAPSARGLGKAPKGYTRPDERIREDICERLMNSPYDASEVEVLVTQGKVTLIGTVLSRSEQWGIEEVAEAVAGVREVHNEIRLEADTHPGDSGHLHS